MGGSVLDALTGCNGPSPARAEIDILGAIRSAAQGGTVAITDISQGGLIAALATMTYNAEIEIPVDGIDPVLFLFNESYGRFLVYGSDKKSIEEALPTCSLTELGFVGGEGIHIRCKSEKITLLPEEVKRARESLTALMYQA